MRAWVFRAALVASALVGLLADDPEMPGGGKPIGVMPPVLFRSSQCATDVDGLVCSGNGICGTEYYPWTNEDIITCKCYDGYTGPDCSLRLCPAGVSWADHPFGNDTAHHTFVECSDFGHCDRLTGECVCREHYTGHACERMACPGGGAGYCSGHGTCLNLNEAASFDMHLSNRADPFDGTTRLEHAGLRYKKGPKDWDDGSYITGCVCEPGWEGNDCSLRSCPSGDDPMTANQTDDSQLLDCSCFAGVACEGTFRLRFRGASSMPIPFNATVEYLKHFLELIPTISAGGVRVANVETRGQPLCSRQGETTRITFLLEHGALPALEPVLVDGSLDVNVAAGGNKSYFYPWIRSVAGQREEVRCSGRGTCDRRGLLRGAQDAGTCECYEAFGPSDKRGSAGTSMDCGHFNSLLTGSTVTSLSKNNSLFGCPVTTALHNTGARLYCSSRGANCSAATGYKCNCTAGYTGNGCEYMDCPASRSWFQEPNPRTGRAHLKGFKCSNGGSCDETTGACECGGLFDGAACHTMPCPVNKSKECGGLGKCWTLNKLAKYSLSPMGEKYNISYQLPWDAFKIRTCNCGRPFAVDSQRQTYRDSDRPALLPTVIEKVFRGPYAYQSTPGMGFDCAKVGCPTGDDVFTPGINEVQEVRCVATGGSFKVMWRESTSPDIAWNMKKQGIILAFEEMLSIGKVDVHFGKNNNQSIACGRDGNHSFFVEFMTEFGDQMPLIDPVVRNADNSYRLFRHGDGEDRAQTRDTGARPGIVQVSRYQKGTKENLECGRQGVCNEDTGYCHCLAGLVSGGGTNHEGHDSYGTNAYGHRGDCGYRHADTRIFNSETRYVGVDPGARFGVE